MKTLAFIRPVVIAACLACLSSSAAAQTDPSAAGNVSGAVSIASGAIAMSRGVFSIPAPFTVPNEEGDLLFNIFPTYSPDSGLSEWGMGWRSAITITRWRPDRRIDFSDSDRFVSPWGPLVKSPADDFWYPEGITQLVRVEFVPAPVGDTISKFIAYLPDGRIATFTDYKYARLFGTTGVELESRFEWSLESVRDALGRTMNVGYRVVDGRRLIDTVEYGGLGENHPYKIKINYGAADPASNTAIATFRGGYQERFSRRVTSIDCFSHATDQPRWSYLLEHDNNATNPAVFYLRSVTKVFRSGARQPPIRYHYRVHGEELASARALLSNELTGFLRGQGIKAAQLLPPRDLQDPGAIYYDEGQDGLVDFVLKTPSADRGSIDPLYRFFVRSRATTALSAFKEARLPWRRPEPNPLVFDFLTGIVPFGPDRVNHMLFAGFGRTVPVAGQQAGQLNPAPKYFGVRHFPTGVLEHDFYAMYEAFSQVPPENTTTSFFEMALGPVLADFDGDHALEVLASRREVIVSRRLGAEFEVDRQPWELDVAPLPPPEDPDDPQKSLVNNFSRKLSLGASPLFWIGDINGDGLSDVLSREIGSGKFFVDYSKPARGMFPAPPVPRMRIAFSGASARVLTGTARLQFFDANKDGLTDILAVFPETTLVPALFLNAGVKEDTQLFNQVTASGLTDAWLTSQNVDDVLAQDLVGDGGNHLLFLFDAADGTPSVFDLPITSPSTGLMIAADDGQGVSYSFDYTYAPPAENVPRRAVVVRQMVASATGEEPRIFQYAFEEPLLHPADLHAVGFQRVTMTENTRSLAVFSKEIVTFANNFDQGDFNTLVPKARRLSGQGAPGIEVVETFSYLPATVRGLPMLRLGAHRSALTKTTIPTFGPPQTVSVYEDDAINGYFEDFCPSKSTHTRSEGLVGSGNTSLITETCYDVTGPGCASVQAPARPPAFEKTIACFPKRVTRYPALAATPKLVSRFAWNERGQLVDVFDGEGSDELHVSHTEYDGDGLVLSVSRPGRGTTSYTYDAEHKPMLASIATVAAKWTCSADPSASACDRDPITSALRSAAVNGVDRRFAYDDQERLVRSWSNALRSSATMPLIELEYQNPTADLLGAVKTKTLVDAATGASRMGIALHSASGRPVAQASAVEGGWAFSSFETHLPGMTTRHVQPQTVTTAPMQIAFADLKNGARVVATSQASAIGLALSEEAQLHEDVVGKVSFKHDVTAAGHVQSVTENDDPLLTTTSTVSAGGAMRSFSDQAGATGRYHADAFGRLAHVELPDDKTHIWICYDSHSRPASIVRFSVKQSDLPADPCSVAAAALGLTVSYTYDPMSGLLRTKSFGVGGVAHRHQIFDYDEHGRVLARVDVGDDGARRDSYLFFYDGRTAQNPAATLPNARGKLSYILGPGFSKSFTFSADGRLEEAIVNTLGERALVSKFEYFADGSPMAETVQVIVPADGAAACLDEGMRRDLFLDGLGRVRQVMVHAGASDRDKLRYGSAANPSPLLADVHYDHLGRVGEIALADGTVFKPKYDDHTLARVGFARNVANGAAGAEVSATVRYGKRGRIESEEQDVVGAHVSRAYEYNAQGFIDTATDTSDDPALEKSFSYNFDAARGDVTKIDGTNTNVPQNVFAAGGSSMKLGSGSKAIDYTMDALGRVVTRKAGTAATVHYLYGANGQLHCASTDAAQCEYQTTDGAWRCGTRAAGTCVAPSNGSGHFEFVYDEGGQRIAKLKDGVWQSSNIGGRVIDSDRLTQPIAIAGVDIGTLSKGELSTLFTDVRGTLVGAPAPSGPSALASPFGARTDGDQPDVSAVSNFIGQPRDADTGLVRLGVRDYDPAIGRFMQPDTLYIESPQLCLGDHVGCNLFSYAGNDPANFVDPNGQFLELILAGGTASVAAAVIVGVAAVAITAVALGYGIDSIVRSVQAAAGAAPPPTPASPGPTAGAPGSPGGGGGAGGVGGAPRAAPGSAADVAALNQVLARADAQNGGTSWLRSAFAAGSNLFRFSTGLNPRFSLYGPNSPVTTEMRTSPAYQTVWQTYVMYAQRTNGGSPVRDTRSVPAPTSMMDQFANPMRFFVGKHTAEFYPIGPRSVRVELWNPTSVTSLGHGIFDPPTPQHPNDYELPHYNTGGPGSDMFQMFIFFETLPDSTTEAPP